MKKKMGKMIIEIKRLKQKIGKDIEEIRSICKKEVDKLEYKIRIMK
jgi:hypothetical protein